MKMVIKMFYVFGWIWNGKSNITHFWFSKLFFYVFIEEFKNRRTTFIIIFIF